MASGLGALDLCFRWLVVYALTFVVWALGCGLRSIRLRVYDLASRMQLKAAKHALPTPQP